MFILHVSKMASTRLDRVLGLFVLTVLICRCAAVIEDEDAVYRTLIPRLMARVDNLETEFSKQKTELQESKENQALLEIEIHKLRAALEEQKSSNQALRELVAGNKKRQSTLQRDMASLRKHLGAMTSLENRENVKESSVVSKHIHREDRTHSQKGKSSRVKHDSKILSPNADAESDTNAVPFPNKRFVLAEPGAGIAFTAYLDHDLNGLGLHQAIPFNQVLLNDGNAYNVHTGAFTCPQNGVYLFSFFLGTLGQSQVWVKLTVNSAIKVEGIADGFHDGQDIQGGNLAILRLSQGDAVVVQVDGGTHLEGSKVDRFTTFSGTLLYSV